MMARPFLLAAVLLAAALAGCSSGNSNDDVVPDDGLKPTATTGIIRGVVVDNAIRPIPGVDIALTVPEGPPLSAKSDASGSFGFANLKPGTYFVKAQKIGYFDAQQSVQVEAGVEDPPVMKILLSINVDARPFFQVQSFEGFVECTTSVVVLCGAPNLVTTLWCSGDLDPLPPQCFGNVTNDRFTNDFYFADNASLIQFEMAWDSTQTLSPEMYFELETLNAGCDTSGEVFLNNTSGPSAIYATVNQTQIEDHEIGTVCPIYFSAFSGDATGDPSGQGLPIGVTFEQRFTLFIHEFHGFLPPPGWRFTVDGDPVVPT